MDTITFDLIPACVACHKASYYVLRVNGLPLMQSDDLAFLQGIALEARAEALAHEMHCMAFDVLHHQIVGHENMRIAAQDAL